MSDLISENIEIINKYGIHIRAAEKFVRVAKKFSVDILVTNGKKQANAKSIMDVVALAAKKGSLLTISADGEDAQAAIDALNELINTKFGEAE